MGLSMLKQFGIIHDIITCKYRNETYIFALIEKYKIFDRVRNVYPLVNYVDEGKDGEEMAEANVHVLLQASSSNNPDMDFCIVPINWLERLMLTHIPGAAPIADWVGYFYGVEVDNLYGKDVQEL